MKGPKIQENCAPLIRRPPAQRGLRGPKLRHCIASLDKLTFREEVWLHEDCICWSPGVYMIGFDIYGLEEIFKVARFTVSLYNLVSYKNFGYDFMFMRILKISN